MPPKTASKEAAKRTSPSDEVLALCRNITPLLWARDVDALSELLDSNIAFASTFSKGYVYGRADVIQEVTNTISSRYDNNSSVELHDEHYSVRPMGDATFLATAQYTARITEPDALIGGLQMFAVLSSMVWRHANNEHGYALVLCHISWRDVSPGGTPSATLASTRRITLHAHDSQGTMYWVAPENVVFASASRQYTEVHCINRTIRLRGSFNSVLEQLGDAVVRVHRSYAVNPAYVSLMEGEMLYLTTGDKVPVPSRRLVEVRELLEASNG